MESMRKSNISNRLLQSHYDIQFAQLVQSIYSTESKIFFENGMIPKLLRQYWIFLTFHFIKETE